MRIGYMNKKLKTLGLMIAVSLFASGCSSFGNKNDNITINDNISIMPPTEDPLMALKRISIEARDEMRLIAKSQQAKAQMSMTPEQHEQKSFQALYVPKGFETMVSIRYVGTAEQVAALVSEAAGYEFRVYGRKPPISMFVNINLHNQPLNDALKELGLQTGDSATVEVYEDAKLIVLNYDNRNH